MRWRTLRPRHRNRVEVLRQRAPHQLLEVPASATAEEVKAAYRRQVRFYHPDVVDSFLKAHSEEVMKLLNEACSLMLRRLRR